MFKLLFILSSNKYTKLNYIDPTTTTAPPITICKPGNFNF